MSRQRPNQITGKFPAVRCAVYTRKSSEEGLEQEFNSLDAQRESGELYVSSQRSEGWVCLADRYDDGGYTGGNMERPGLKQLMADIDAGKIDCVVVYKVDRLSRSLLDFARIMEVFDRKEVSFVSVTQQFNTTHSMGRLTLNILLSFAQFEREIISERTRDKIAATRRKGKWFGGKPILGYDVVGGKLIVNPLGRYDEPGQGMSESPIDPGVRVGHVHLKVADLDRALAFYHGVLGFEITQRYGTEAVFLSAGGYHHHIGLNTWESKGGKPPPRGTTGLFHVAILYPTRTSLADALRRIRSAGVPLDGASDHGVSEALYLRDPDGNGVELYWDRPQDEWPRDVAGGIAMFTRPLDLRELARA